MVIEHRTNFSNGYVVEYIEDGQICDSWLLLPAENLWPVGLRCFLYILALAYMFLGIAIASDVFMCSIEVITSKKRTVVRWDEERKEKVERSVLLWNETVANLTLMALGSSAPEILLATCEMISEINDRDAKDALGTFTIIGSAAFNLLIITAVCIMSVPTGQIKSIKEQGVFVVTSIWSIWAYVWMLLVVKYISPGQIDPWEAWVTLSYMPLFVGMAYITDRGWLCALKRRVGQEDEESGELEDEVAVRVVSHQHQGAFTHSMPKELRVLEAEKAHRMSVSGSAGCLKAQRRHTTAMGIGSFANLRKPRLESHINLATKAPLPRKASQVKFPLEGMSGPSSRRKSSVYSRDGGPHRVRFPEEQGTSALQSRRRSSVNRPDGTHLFARARFRHAAVSALMGSSSFHRIQEKGPRMAEVVNKVKLIGDAIMHGTDPEKLKEMLRRESFLSFAAFQFSETSLLIADLLGKFTFSADRYAVMDTAEFVEVDVLLHRWIPSVAVFRNSTTIGSVDPADEQRPPIVLSPNCPPEDAEQPDKYVRGVYTVDYETREGSAKMDRDFIFQQGTLTFTEKEYMVTVKVPVKSDGDREADVDFYIILKNPTGGAELGDPSIARITIMDDKEPGEFLFEEPTYYANMKSEKVTVRVIREHGFNGVVTLDYSTINGTAVGGAELKDGVDFVECHGQLKFEHAETVKTVTIPVNKNSAGSKNFIIAIRNPSVGAKVGIRSAAVIHMNKGGRTSKWADYDELMERVEEVLEDDEGEAITWGGQFVQAMTVEAQKDEDGNEIPAAWNHYLMHFLTFSWKIFCAMIPPTSYLGAWPAFTASLLCIGAMTAVVEQLGKLLGCVVGLQTSVAGITIIALGTSLPDTFASRTAALQDEHADAAIGNITGSNSVNVFLGLGLPWVLKTMHAVIYGYTFKVNTDNLTQSVLIFGTAGCVCIISLLVHRKVFGGELGGNFLVKYSMVCLFAGLWVIYVIVISLHAYNVINIPEF